MYGGPRHGGLRREKGLPLAPDRDRVRGGVYGHFAHVDWSQVFNGPQPELRLMHEEPESTQDTNQTTGR